MYKNRLTEANLAKRTDHQKLLEIYSQLGNLAGRNRISPPSNLIRIRVKSNKKTRQIQSRGEHAPRRGLQAPTTRNTLNRQPVLEIKTTLSQKPILTDSRQPEKLKVMVQDQVPNPTEHQSTAETVSSQMSATLAIRRAHSRICRSRTPPERTPQRMQARQIPAKSALLTLKLSKIILSAML